jgi:hypothetical protein
VGFNPTISVGERQQTDDRAATEAGRLSYFRQILTSMHIFNRSFSITLPSSDHDY